MPLINNRNRALLAALLAFVLFAGIFYFVAPFSPGVGAGLAFLIAALLYAIITENMRAKRAEESLRSGEKKFQDLVEQSGDWIWEVDNRGIFTYVNPGVKELTGYGAEEMIGKSPFAFMRQGDVNEAKRLFYDAAARQEPFSLFEYGMVHKNGHQIVFEVNGRPISGKGGASGGYRGISREITERKRRAVKLEYFSLHDQLTGLYNRAFFAEEMKRLSGSRDFPITIVSADINGLKLINDTMGHSKGDALLYACAQVLRLSLRRSDILARIGGDEFAALLPRTGEAAGETIAGRIQVNMDLHNKTFPELPLSISVGTATAEKEDTPLTEIYKKADDYMYRNKFSNRNSVRSYIVDILLAALAERDRISQGHAERLAALCLKMGDRLDLPPSRISGLDLLAWVHDLGNVGVPDSILFKETSLTGEEWELIRQHPEKGYRIARFSPKLKRVAGLILQHHERWDGSGYPRGLSGEAIALECRIFAIADAYEAMTGGGRAYREAKGKTAALKEIEKHAGSQFDPILAEVFCALT